MSQICYNPHWAHSPSHLPIEFYHSHPTLISPILIIGGVHGDEPEGVYLSEATLEWLKSSQKPMTSHWALIPCLNPDGYQSHSRHNSNGVDLNRNYPSCDWSPEYENKRYHPGPYGGSEPEVKALVKLIHQVSPKLIIHCHSWKPCVVYTGPPAQPYAQYLGDSSSYEVIDTIGYKTPGSLSQYAWHDHQTPVICIEEAKGTARQDVWKHFGPGMQKIFSVETQEGLQ